MTKRILRRADEAVVHAFLQEAESQAMAAAKGQNGGARLSFKQTTQAELTSRRDPAFQKSFTEVAACRCLRLLLDKALNCHLKAQRKKKERDDGKENNAHACKGMRGSSRD